LKYRVIALWAETDVENHAVWRNQRWRALHLVPRFTTFWQKFSSAGNGITAGDFSFRYGRLHSASVNKRPDPGISSAFLLLLLCATAKTSFLVSRATALRTGTQLLDYQVPKRARGGAHVLGPGRSDNARKMCVLQHLEGVPGSIWVPIPPRGRRARSNFERFLHLRSDQLARPETRILGRNFCAPGNFSAAPIGLSLLSQ